MATYSGVLLNSSGVVLGAYYTGERIPKAFFNGNLYDFKDKILFSSGNYVAGGNKIFTSGFLLDPGLLYYGTPYSKVNTVKNYFPGAILTPVARSGEAGDNGILIVNGFYADFSATPRQLYTYETVSFLNYVYGPRIKTYLWNFGDGTTSTDPNPLHSYSAGGIYNINLRVTSINDETTDVIKNSYILVSEYPAGDKDIYFLVITNKRVTPYRKSSPDVLQIKAQIYSNSKRKLSYIKDVPLNLKLNYQGWRAYETINTDKFGSCTFHHTCSNVDRDHCLGFVTALIDNKMYTSNIARFNFI